MNPAASREALAVLAELCDLSPDVRMGQLLAHLGFLGEDRLNRYCDGCSRRDPNEDGR